MEKLEIGKSNTKNVQHHLQSSIPANSILLFGYMYSFRVVSPSRKFPGPSEPVQLMDLDHGAYVPMYQEKIIPVLAFLFAPCKVELFTLGKSKAYEEQKNQLNYRTENPS